MDNDSNTQVNENVAKKARVDTPTKDETIHQLQLQIRNYERLSKLNAHFEFGYFVPIQTDSTDDFPLHMSFVLIVLFHIQELRTLMVKNPPDDASEPTYSNYYKLMRSVWRKGAVPLAKYPYINGKGQYIRFTSDGADDAADALDLYNLIVYNEREIGDLDEFLVYLFDNIPDTLHVPFFKWTYAENGTQVALTLPMIDRRGCTMQDLINANVTPLNVSSTGTLNVSSKGASTEATILIICVNRSSHIAPAAPTKLLQCLTQSENDIAVHIATMNDGTSATALLKFELIAEIKHVGSESTEGTFKAYVQHELHWAEYSKHQYTALSNRTQIKRALSDISNGTENEHGILYFYRLKECQ